MNLVSFENAVDKVITKNSTINQMRSDISSLREEMRSDISSLREEMGSDISSLREEMGSDISSLREKMKSDMSSLQNQMSANVDSLQKQMNRISVTIELMQSDNRVMLENLCNSLNLIPEVDQNRSKIEGLEVSTDSLRAALKKHIQDRKIHLVS